MKVYMYASELRAACGGAFFAEQRNDGDSQPHFNLGYEVYSQGTDVSSVHRQPINEELYRAFSAYARQMRKRCQPKLEKSPIKTALVPAKAVVGVKMGPARKRRVPVKEPQKAPANSSEEFLASFM